jgi:type IV pilus assembly protein PilQ
MRAFTAIISYKLLVVFSLFLSFGCAQNTYSVKDAKQESADLSTLRTVTVSGEGETTRVEITADKPLTYTYYALRDPFRTVIDLSQADPGTVQAPEISSTSKIKNITIAKNELTAGALVRITLETTDQSEFTVIPDPTNPQKLIVALAGNPSPTTTKSEPEVTEAVKASPPENKEKTASPDKVVESAASSAPIEAQAQAQPQPQPVPSDRKAAGTQVLVTSIDVEDSAIQVRSNGEIDKYKYFTLTKPQRLVLDIYHVKSSMATSSVSLRKLGVENARIGIYPEKLRIVFDSKKALFPEYAISKSASGLSIKIGSAVQASDATIVKVNPPKSKDSMQSMPTAGSKVPARIDAIDFSIVDGFSRIAVTRVGECSFEQPKKTADGLILTFSECVLPKRLQRPFDSSAFASSVKKMTPYQSRVKGKLDAKILVSTLGDPNFTVKRDGQVIIVDIKNPETQPVTESSSAKLASSQPAPVNTAINPSNAPQVPFTRKNEYARETFLPTTVEKRSDKKIYTGKKVTLEFADADIRKIFQLIAEVSNKNILVGDDVSGTISIKLVNVPWDQALDVILQTKGLDKKEDGNIMIIRPAGKIASIADEELAARRAYERTLELRTRVFDINYASVSDVAGQFNTYKSERGTISLDSRTNRVIVNDVSPAIEKMASLLRELDIPEKQVLIEARIVEATSSFTQDLGIQWGIHAKDGSGSFLGINSLDTGFGGIITNVPPISGFQAASAAGGALGLSFGKLTSNLKIDMRLSAAAESGQVKIISTPKVVTLNNKAAKISQGQMIPYSTVSAEGTKTEFVEAALTLEVTPHITANGAVSMKIKATNNSAGSAATGVAPPINKKEATTELLVQNGETTVIGGIYVDTDSTTDSGVPFLMDIPLLGWLFKSNNQKKSKSELLIFITPKIVI